jgi:hypothetical protein
MGKHFGEHQKPGSLVVCDLLAMLAKFSFVSRVSCQNVPLGDYLYLD